MAAGRQSGENVAVGRLLSVVLVLVVAALGGCSQSDASDEGEKLDRIAAARDLLGDYVGAMNDADVAGAMHLRCKDMQIPEDQFDLFETQARQLIEAAGPFEVEGVRAGPEAAGVKGLFSFSIKGHEGRLTASILNEEGRDVLCYWRPAASYEIQDSLSGKVADLGAAPAAPDALLPDSVGEAYHLAVPAGREPVEMPSNLLVKRAWQDGKSGGITVTVGKYADGAAALERANSLIDEVLADSVAIVALSAAPDAVAVQFLGFAWLFVQPPSLPPYVIRAVLPFGDTVATVQVSGTEPANLKESLNSVVTDIVGRVS